jgi:hypothetical protein
MPTAPARVSECVAGRARTPPVTGAVWSVALMAKSTSLVKNAATPAFVLARVRPSPEYGRRRRPLRARRPLQRELLADRACNRQPASVEQSRRWISSSNDELTIAYAPSADDLPDPLTAPQSPLEPRSVGCCSGRRDSQRRSGDRRELAEPDGSGFVSAAVIVGTAGLRSDLRPVLAA